MVFIKRLPCLSSWVLLHGAAVGEPNIINLLSKLRQDRCLGHNNDYQASNFGTEMPKQLPQKYFSTKPSHSLLPNDPEQGFRPLSQLSYNRKPVQRITYDQTAGNNLSKIVDFFKDKLGCKS